MLELAAPPDEPRYALTAHGPLISAFEPTTRKPGRPLSLTLQESARRLDALIAWIAADSAAAAADTAARR